MKLYPLWLTVLLAACGTQAPRPVVSAGETAPPAAAAPAASPAPKAEAKKPLASYVLKKGGGFYKDDGPGDNPPPDLEAIADAVPRAEPLHRFANNPYSVFGRDYVPLRELGNYREKGFASWYGRKFHGQKTSSGEAYDMYGMTAAHPTLPIPSYARVTNPANGRSVIVRVNDRGPFHAGRVIDLSFTAAWKLGYVGTGSTLVEVESITPGQDTALARAPAKDKAEPDPIARLAEAPLPETREAKGLYLQLGAFGNRDNAESFQSRVTRDLDWLADRVSIRVAGNLHRIQVGPWKDRAEAEGIAERVRNALGFNPTIVVR